MDINDLTIRQVKQLGALFSGDAIEVSAKHESHEKRAVVVWTDKQAVLFGYTTNYRARPITLTDARMCLYWDTRTGGVFGLCDKGPNDECRISAKLPKADFEGVTGVAEVSTEAEAAWLAAPVQGRDK